MRAMPSRIRRWSSTHRTRMGVAIAGLLRGQWDCGLDGSTGSRITDERQAAAQPRRTLTHREEAKMLTGRRRWIALLRDEPTAIVGDRQPHAVFLEVQRDVNLSGTPVFDGVGHRLLCDSLQLHVGIARARPRTAGN